MGRDEMTQDEAVRRAWAAAERAEQAELTLGESVRWARISQAWAAVASQLPLLELVAPSWSRVDGQFVRSDEAPCPRPAAHMAAEHDGTWPPGQVPVPVPRPLRDGEQRPLGVVSGDDLRRADAERAEQAAAADALRGRDPFDPRVTLAELDETAVIEVKAHEPISHSSSSGTCRRCASAIEWRGGVWIDVTGGALCRTPSQ